MVSASERFNVVAAVTNAEMNHLHDMRREDFNRIFREYLRCQREHHQTIVEILGNAESKFQ